MNADRSVKCIECGITWSSHPDFLNHISAIERHEDPRIKKALAMYDQVYPDQHAGPCSHVACQMARTLRR